MKNYDYLKILKDDIYAANSLLLSLADVNLWDKLINIENINILENDISDSSIYSDLEEKNSKNFNIIDLNDDCLVEKINIKNLYNSI